MELVRKVSYLVFCSLLLAFSGATYEEILSDKNKQAEYLEKQIQINKEFLSEKNSQLVKLRMLIDSIESEVNDLSVFLKDYEKASYMSPGEVASETNSVLSLAAEVDRIQESFRKKVINLYKHGKYFDLELLFSSRSPNEYLQRNQYLQHFAQNRKKELRELKSKKFILEEKKKMLSLSTSSQRFYVESRRNQRTELESKLKVLSAQKENIEYDANINTERINRYQIQLNNLKNYLNNFKDYKNTFKGTKSVRLNYESNDLNQLKGNLNQPLDAAVTISDFGSYVNNATNTISFNNGIDYSVSKGTKVFSVASGTVTIVGDLPFYGKCVIVKHDNGFRSVYASLGETNVNAGDLIKLNQVIGRTGESPEGQMLHFELWKDASPLSPVEWLRQ